MGTFKIYPCAGAALRKCVDSLALNFQGIHIYISEKKKKKCRERGLLSGSLAEYGPAGGDSLLLPPTVPLKTKGSWE